MGFNRDDRRVRINCSSRRRIVPFQSGETVDTAGVFFSLIRIQCRLTFVNCPILELRAVFLEFVDGDGISTRIGNACEFDENDGAGHGRCWKSCGKFGESRRGFLDDLSATMKADNFRWPLECAKHQDNPAVVPYMGNGFGATSDKVEISDRGWGKNAKTIQSLRRKVDVAGCVRRRRRHEKHVLRSNEFDDGIL